MENTVIVALNEQINFELYSGYIYLQLSLAMEKKNYKGYSNWLKKHYHEELRHAEDFIEFMLKRGVTPTLKTIEVKDFDVSEPIEVANIVFDHEKKVTNRIYELHDVAKKSKRLCNRDIYAFIHF